MPSIHRSDLLVIGSGIAGLSTALKAAEAGLKVTVLAKRQADESNTRYAQGGIASVLREDDSFLSHIEDTLKAGAGLCDPKVVEAVHWAAKNGDRSENGDYLYGKKRLREIDRRIRFLTKRLEIAEVTDPSVHHGSDQVYFGATVTYADETGEERTVTILGIDEAESSQHQVSWISPIARALLKSREGDVVKLVTPGGVHEVEVLEVRYPQPA